MLEGVRDDGHAEAVALRITHGQTDAINRYGTLLHSDIAFGSHLGRHVVTELAIAAAVNLLHALAHCGAVNMALNYVAVKFERARVSAMAVTV